MEQIKENIHQHCNHFIPLTIIILVGYFKKPNQATFMEISIQIQDILNSESFKNYLEKINLNYSNLKQENLIRNAVLELYNHEYATSNIKAFAEHPRLEKNNEEEKINGRVDLSIVNKQHLDKPYKIEFKYHFTKHRNNFLNYSESIKNEFIIRQSNMFILIVQTVNVDEKNEYDDFWGIDTKLTKYQSKTNDWYENLMNCYNEITNVVENSCELFEPIKIEIQKPYHTQYHFYILSKK